jgi:hypothetical protein
LFILSSCGKEEQQATPQGPAKFAVQKITTEDATTYRDFTANIEGQQNGNPTKSERFYTKNIC